MDVQFICSVTIVISIIQEIQQNTNQAEPQYNDMQCSTITTLFYLKRL